MLSHIDCRQDLSLAHRNISREWRKEFKIAIWTQWLLELANRSGTSWIFDSGWKFYVDIIVQVCVWNSVRTYIGSHSRSRLKNIETKHRKSVRLATRVYVSEQSIPWKFQKPFAKIRTLIPSYFVILLTYGQGSTRIPDWRSTRVNVLFYRIEVSSFEIAKFNKSMLTGEVASA